MEKEEIRMRRTPVIDLSRCTGCESCISICPDVFRINGEMGYLEVADLPEYPEDKVEEAMSLCPADCIEWEESPG